MPILIACECGRQYRTDDSNIGREARCSVCGRAMTVANAPLDLEPWLKTEPAGRPFSGRAVASLVLGALSIVLMAFTGLPAIALGCIGIGDIRRSRRRLRGEYLAMVGIALGVFGSTVFPLVVVPQAIVSVREAIHRAQCVANLKRIGMAMHSFHSARNAFPTAAIYDQKGRPLLSWRVAILPFLGPEEAELYDRFHRNEPWDSPHNRKLLAEMPAVYRCPDTTGALPGVTTYQVLVGPGTLFNGRKAGTLEDIKKSIVFPVLAIEADHAVPWTAPMDVTFDPADPGSMQGIHHGGMYHTLSSFGSVHSQWKSPQEADSSVSIPTKSAKP